MYQVDLKKPRDMTRPLVSFVVASVWSIAGAAQPLTTQTIAVPAGDGIPVMTDGVFLSEEWADAISLPLGETAELFLKEHGGHVFVGVHCGNLEKPFSVNLYLAGPGGNIHQLHGSAQIGERILTPGEEDPAWIWGYSPGWYANEVRWNQLEAQALMEEGNTQSEAVKAALFGHDGFEFQLLRDKFPGNEWILRVEIKSYPDYESPLIYPEETSSDHTDGWLRLSLQSL